MFLRKQQPVDATNDVTKLLGRLVRISADEAERLSRRWIDSPFAVAARRKVLHPKTPGVVDLLGVLDQLSTAWPYTRDSPEDAAAYHAACDVLIATYGRHRLTTAQYLTLMGPAWRAEVAEP
jgi:hypothetical protein